MNPPFFNLCIIPAAGQGTRMGELCRETPKCLLPVNGKPILQHILEYWRSYTQHICVLVTPAHYDRTKQFVGQRACEVYRKPDLLNLPQAIAWAYAQSFPPIQRVIVVLGDCLVRGTFAWDHLTPPYNGIGVTAGTTDFARSYAVQVRGGFVLGVQEKPLLGMGVYFFSDSVMPWLERAASLTEAVHKIARRKCLMAVPFTGEYLNVTYPEDLERWPA